MTQEEKEVLLKDLSARLPYGVKVNEDIQGIFTLIGLAEERIFTTCEVEGWHNDFPIELIKPYLIPLSIMTEEELNEYKHLVAFSGSPNGAANFIDWLNAHHFDYNGLIPMGLAIDATGLNIY